MDSYIDKTIGGYTIKKFIAKGGMGSVFYAKHPHLKERAPVAIKVLHRHLLDTGNLKERFRREANIQARLRHKSLIKLLEYLEDEQDCYIIMEYFKSKSLSDIIGRQTGPMPSERAVPIFKQILEGIEYAHDNNIIHRDIKPSNILIGKDDIVKITDFGIAKMVGNNKMTATGSVVGTRLYMSPEQIQGKRATKKSDIYSLGVTFYEMLAGRVPFESSNEFTVMEGHINKKPDPPTKHYPYIPENIVDAVMKAMEKKPGSRFKDCNEFIQVTKGKIKVKTTKKPVVKPKKKKVEKSEKKSWQGWAATIVTGLFVLFIYLNVDDGTTKSIPIPTPRLTPKPTTKPTSTPTSRRSADYYYQLGYKEYEKENFTKAISLFTQAITRDEKHHKSRFFRSWSYWNQDSFSTAMFDANYLIKYRGDSEDYNLRGWIKSSTNKYTSSISDFDAAVNLSPEVANNFIGRGLSKFANSEYTRALSDASKAIKLEDDNPDVYYLRGIIFIAMNKVEIGCQDLRKSMDLETNLMDEEYYEDHCN